MEPPFKKKKKKFSTLHVSLLLLESPCLSKSNLLILVSEGKEPLVIQPKNNQESSGEVEKSHNVQMYQYTLIWQIKID